MPPSTTIDRKPKSRVVCTVRFEESDFAPAEALALERLGMEVEIKGFRKGMAPVEMLRSKISQDQLFEEAVRILLQPLIPSLLQEHKIQPVVAPKVEVLSRFPLSATVTFVERPEVRIKGIEKLSIAKKEVKADQKDIDRVIRSALQEHRQTAPSSSPAKSGDQVTVDFTATDTEGKPIEGMQATDYAITIGSSQLLPGFEDELIGLKTGDQKTFTLTMPEKFPLEQLRGKPVQIQATVKQVEQVTLPELTDAFAKEKMNLPSAQAFKDLVEKSLREQEEQFDRMRRERELLEEVKKRTEIDLADELIEEEMRQLISEWSERLEERGTTIAEVLKKDGKKPEDVEKDLKAQAEERWKLRLGMAKIIEEKKITVTDQETEHAFQDLLTTLPQDQHPAATEQWKAKGALYEELRWKTMVEKAIEEMLG